MYVYENPQQKRFSVGELSKYFVVGSAPIYNTLKARPDLIERNVKGKKAFDRSSI